MDFDMFTNEEYALIYEALVNMKYKMRKSMDEMSTEHELYKALVTEYNKYSVLCHKILCEYERSFEHE